MGLNPNAADEERRRRMFTVKHVEYESGHESISAAKRVSYDSGDTISTAHAGIRGVTVFESDGSADYLCGDVFIMNDNGATVGVYRHLGPIPGFNHEQFAKDKAKYGLPVASAQA